jgi:hypothetical protein
VVSVPLCNSCCKAVVAAVVWLAVLLVVVVPVLVVPVLVVPVVDCPLVHVPLWASAIDWQAVTIANVPAEMSAQWRSRAVRMASLL